MFVQGSVFTCTFPILPTFFNNNFYYLCHSKNKSPMASIIIIGSGLCGTLMALRMAQKGYLVDVYEKRPDMRNAKIGERKIDQSRPFGQGPQRTGNGRSAGKSIGTGHPDARPYDS
ncbi:MAG: NAD(P)-binding protein [Saprospiraceae bacterium]|nr:NAD(P)-binding protein [Saprospiraceae bacterium]